MYELIKITDNDFYVDCPAKIGLVRVGGDGVILIDSGSDKDAGKKVFRILEENHWQLKAIYNTHSHADHIGGNKFLQDKTGCSIYAKSMEAVYSNDPVLEPSTLYGGRPFKDISNKFLMAKESKVLPLTDDVLPEGFELLSLPGHSFDMVGFKTPDGTAYIADCVSSGETLEKYGIAYLWDPNASLKTLEYIRTIDAKCFVPAHANVLTDVDGLAGINEKAILEVKKKIKEICAVPVSFEELLKRVFDEYSMQMTAQQYVLIGSTIRSYLSSMYEDGELEISFSDNRMLWAAK